MISILLSVFGTIIGLLIYYVRTISVLVDERDNIEKDCDSYGRYKWLFVISERMEKLWPVVRTLEATKWAGLLSNIAMVIAIVLLISAGALSELISDYAGFVLVSLFLLASISNGPKSMETYAALKPYLPVIFPAIAYQSMVMLEQQNPVLVQQLTIPGYEFMETKLLAALIGFIMVFVVPYPMAKFDQWFSKFVAKSTLYFMKDFMRLGVKPDSAIEVSLRKAAKESIAVTLKIILAVVAVLGFITYGP
jgi:hypothetical protein